jgi:hypothetical protein
MVYKHEWNFLENIYWFSIWLGIIKKSYGKNSSVPNVINYSAK